MPLAQDAPIRNRLLGTLPEADLARLRPYLELVPLRAQQVLSEPDQPIRDIYFLEAGITSTVADTGDAGRMEIGIMGREAMVGVPVVLGVDNAPHRVFVQVAGAGLRMSADDLRQAMEASPALRRILLRYAQAFLVQVAQAAACNGRHLLHQRLAKWLLEAHDRVDGDEIPLTHEFLGIMLGVRRAGVTTSLGALRSAGIVAESRACITVVDRAKLEEAACPCHGIVRAEFRRMLG